MDHRARLDRLRATLQHPMLVTSLTNIRYLTGFTGSSASLRIAPTGTTHFVTDGRYAEVAEPLVAALTDVELVVHRNGLVDALVDLGAGDDTTLGVESDHMSWSAVRRLRRRLSTEIAPMAGTVEELRSVKDESEVAALRAAAEAGDAAFGKVPEIAAAATTEAELGWGLIEVMRSKGAHQAGWDPIVAAGANAAMPHHRAGTDVLGDGLLLLDYGCTVEGYHSDMSRTMWLSDEPDAEMQHIYDAVLEAQAAGIAAVGPGVVAGDVDMACREALKAHGLAVHFVHSTGHGVGLEIHEAPWVKAGSTDVLEAGHVVTIEPGVYLQGRGGVRIEDMVLVTDGGADVLTSSPKTSLR